jgi:hypothetical protein
MKIELLKYKFANYNNPYHKIEGETPFAKAVNEIVENYWVKTDKVMPLEDAMYSVLADMYNKLT